MKLKDFLTLKVGSGILLSGNVYNPLINYDWSTTTTSGLRYLKDIGSTPAYNASMYFGRGAYLNGVDQTITVPINTTIQTALKRVNGVVTINETSQVLTNYVISGLGVHKDYYLFTRLLTTTEKDSYTNTPELFYAMAQADSTCVLNMPMCETDSYARNMKSYSEGSELDTSFVANNYISNNLLRISQFNLGLVIEANKTYLVEIEYDDTANSILTGYNCYGEKGDGTYAPFHTALKGIVNGTKGTAFYLLQIPSTYPGLNSTTAYAWITTTAAGKTAYISVRSLKKLTGVYPITNYTSSVRDNAKNLRYGLQTCKFVRDSLGVIQSASNHLECDGVGYANTGWIPSASEDFTLEIVKYCPITASIDGDGNNKDDSTRVVVLQTGDVLYPEIGAKISGDNQSIGKIATNVFNHIVVSYNSVTKQVVCYLNGIYKISYISNLTTGTAQYLICKAKYSRLSSSQRRSFKVHNKVLTQAEVKANYNSYVAKGLLS